MSLSNRQRLGIGLLLAIVMLLTRVDHFGVVSDASWAVFFLGGFYLRKDARWAFPAGLLLAVLADAWVIRGLGLNFWDHYCMSVAYWFLVPSYLALWLGGTLLSRVYEGLSLRSLGWLLAIVPVVVSVCFAISNASFYWLSDTVTNATMTGWFKNFGDWYLPYLYTTSLHLSVAAALHAGVALLAGKATAASAAAAR